MTSLQIRMREVPFCNLCCGARFKYTKDETAQFVKIGQDLIAAWKPERVADKWDGQPLCAFSEDGETDTLVWLLEEVAQQSAPLLWNEPAPAITAAAGPSIAKLINALDRFECEGEDYIKLADARNVAAMAAQQHSSLPLGPPEE